MSCACVCVCVYIYMLRRETLSQSSHLCCLGSIPSHKVDTKAGEFCCLAAPRLRFRFQVSVPGNFEVNRPATVYGDNRIHSFGVQV